ncbi:pyocin knob domain-containing protein [Acinetobacter baumannii]
MAQQTIVIEVPGTPISELEPTSSVSPNDVLPVVQGDQTKKAPLEQVADMVMNGLGSAAFKSDTDFATPAAVTAANAASQQRDDAINERVDTVEFSITTIANGADASFNTYAEMIAYTPSKANVSVRVNADPDATKNGTYTWNGTQYNKGFDIVQYLLNIVNALATVKPQHLANATDFNLIVNAGNYFISSQPDAQTMFNLPAAYQLSGSLINVPMSDAVQNGTLRYAYQIYRTGLGTAIERYCVNYVWRDWSVVADKKSMADLQGLALTTSSLEGRHYYKQILQYLGKHFAEYLPSGGTRFPLYIDKNLGTILEVDVTTGEIIGNFSSNASTQTIKSIGEKLPEHLIIAPYKVDHFLFYGQSLSVGATATTILSSTQPLHNLTFDTGTRMQGLVATATKALIEEYFAGQAAPDGGTNRGETVCSGAANMSALLAYQENSIDPAEFPIFASTAGKGGTAIANLKKGTQWYNDVFLLHLNKAKELIGTEYGVSCIGWLQGEQDAAATTSYASYLSQFLQLRQDMEADVQLISGSNQPVHLLTYQMSYRALGPRDVITRALYDATNLDEKIHLVTPTYLFPHNSTDQVHLTSMGYKWLSAYFGRARKELVWDKIFPRSLKVLSATYSGKKIIVKFKVPTRPLVLDTVNLAMTTDYGFRVTDGANTLAIDTINTYDDTVVINLLNAPTSDVYVRYGHDYLGAGLTILNGASGNLRDSTDEPVVIDGQTKPMFYVAPHFELKAVKEAI